MDAAVPADQAVELAALRERATSFDVHLHMPDSLLKSWDAALLQSARWTRPLATPRCSNWLRGSSLPYL